MAPRHRHEGGQTGQGDVPRWPLAAGHWPPTADGRRRCQSANPMAPFSRTTCLACVTAQPCCLSPISCCTLLSKCIDGTDANALTRPTRPPRLVREGGESAP